MNGITFCIDASVLYGLINLVTVAGGFAYLYYSVYKYSKSNEPIGRKRPRHDSDSVEESSGSDSDDSYSENSEPHHDRVCHCDLFSEDNVSDSTSDSSEESSDSDSESSESDSESSESDSESSESDSETTGESSGETTGESSKSGSETTGDSSESGSETTGESTGDSSESGSETTGESTGDSSGESSSEGSRHSPVDIEPGVEIENGAVEIEEGTPRTDEIEEGTPRTDETRTTLE